MKPILFSTPMVRAILAGRKSMTRRVVNLKKEFEPVIDNRAAAHFTGERATCPYHIGQVLWVRETWQNVCEDCGDCTRKGFIYKADGDKGGACCPYEIKWRPSIFMPREAARIHLRVTDVRVERLQDIDNDDAIKEGCAGAPCDCLRLGRGWMGCESCMNTGWQEPPTVEFMQLWEHLNAKRGYGWDTNPWVWVYSFERIRICDMLPSEAITAGCILQSKGDV